MVQLSWLAYVSESLSVQTGTIFWDPHLIDDAAAGLDYK